MQAAPTAPFEQQFEVTQLPLGHVLVLMACGFLIGKVWASLKATWKE